MIGPDNEPKRGRGSDELSAAEGIDGETGLPAVDFVGPDGEVGDAGAAEVVDGKTEHPGAVLRGGLGVPGLEGGGGGGDEDECGIGEEAIPKFNGEREMRHVRGVKTAPDEENDPRIREEGPRSWGGRNHGRRESRVTGI